MSKKKVLSIGLAIEAVVCIILSIIWKGQYDTKLMSGLRTPLEVLGDGLRQLSWSGTAGNVVSWIIYVAVALLPIVASILFIKNKKAGLEEILMVILTAVLFRGIYMFINPSEIVEIEGLISLSEYKDSIAITIYSIIVLYIIIKVLKSVANVTEEKLITTLKYVCAVAMLVLVETIALAGVSELIIGIEAAAKNNQHVVNTCILLGIRFIVAQLPNICLIIIISKLMDVSGAVCKGFFNEEVLAGVDIIARICKNSIIIILLAIMILNLGQLLVTSYVSNTHFTLTVPVFDILLILVILVVSRMITESHKIKEDNDLFI